ncbi:MAG: hypothetical protein methR_P1310 [Methyloprofundus sp.]|nr:MAG: hypothetical protein methR_P1310 [Methyloprofundus sp.]
MQHNIHMQDQVTNRIELIMGDQRLWMRRILEDLMTFSLITAMLAVGIVW